MMKLVDVEDSSVFRFQFKEELVDFKSQHYMQRYLRTVQSIDDNVGRILELLDSDPQLAENTIVIYTTDQGFFLGEHEWFGKRFIYEGSFQMPLMARKSRLTVSAPILSVTWILHPHFWTLPI